MVRLVALQRNLRRWGVHSGALQNVGELFDLNNDTKGEDVGHR